MFEEYENLRREYLQETSDRDISPYGGHNFQVDRVFTPEDDLRLVDKLYFFLGTRMSDGKEATLADWVAALETCDSLRVCRFKNPSLHQELFDALSSVKTLERLFLDTHRSRVESLDSIANLSALTHLTFSSSPRITDLSPLAKLPSLKALAFDGNYGTHDLTKLENLSSLETLTVAGRYGKPWKIDSLGFISNLPNLKNLRLGYFEIADESLDAVCKKTSLEYFEISSTELKRLPLKQYELLWEKRPDLKSAFLEPAATDRAFQKKYRIK